MSEPIESDESVGLYVHVPFCERVCPYCAFAVVAARPLEESREDRYVDALLRELEHCAPAFEGRRLVSLYLGGGTPSLLRPSSVARILAAARARFDGGPSNGNASAEIEITLEVNPSSLERERLPAFRRVGVNRLSVGIQSFDDTLLRRLGRAHKAEEGRRTLETCRRAGFENVSVDLLYAGPGSTPKRLQSDIDELLAFAPEHVSTYELNIEPGTPFALAAARGQLALPHEEQAIEMAEILEKGGLDRAGLARYELSSYARPGFEAIHNRRYWERLPVLGLGVGAWSTTPRSGVAPHGGRRANLRELEAYLKSVETSGSAPAEAEILDPPTARGEAMFLSLRRMAGLEAARFATEFGGPPRHFFAQVIDELTKVGLMTENRMGDLTLTVRGQLLSDSVFERFV